MVASCSYASAARWAYRSASVKFGGVGGKKAVGFFFPQEETLTTASAKTPSIKGIPEGRKIEPSASCVARSFLRVRFSYPIANT